MVLLRPSVYDPEQQHNMFLKKPDFSFISKVFEQTDQVQSHFKVLHGEKLQQHHRRGVKCYSYVLYIHIHDHLCGGFDICPSFSQPSLCVHFQALSLSFSLFFSLSVFDVSLSLIFYPPLSFRLPSCPPSTCIAPSSHDNFATVHGPQVLIIKTSPDTPAHSVRSPVRLIPQI